MPGSVLRSGDRRRARDPHGRRAGDRRGQQTESARRSAQRGRHDSGQRPLKRATSDHVERPDGEMNRHTPWLGDSTRAKRRRVDPQRSVAVMSCSVPSGAGVLRPWPPRLRLTAWLPAPRQTGQRQAGQTHSREDGPGGGPLPGWGEPPENAGGGKPSRAATCARQQQPQHVQGPDAGVCQGTPSSHGAPEQPRPQRLCNRPRAEGAQAGRRRRWVTRERQESQTKLPRGTN